MNQSIPSSSRNSFPHIREEHPKGTTDFYLPQSLPPVTATQHELPFMQLSWEQFERLCLRLIQARGYKLVEHLGRAGNEQGRDIIAWDEDISVAVQCKRVKKFTAADGRREIGKLLALGESSRPQRIIFMVTCSISSSARDEIRRAWNEDKNSCEFVAATELDAEVRSNNGILQEFFQVPGRIAATNWQHEIKCPERQSKGVNELRKIELTNREWAVTSGSVIFLRLLQSIEEVTHLAGRLEIGRAFHEAVQKSGAVIRATGQNLLQVCDELESHKLFQLNWKLRRMLARIIGDILGMRVGIQQINAVGSFCERHMESKKGILLLAEAASEHTVAASTIGESRLRKLLLSKHPQAKWQLLRRWPIVSPVISKGIDIEEIMEISDVGAKRMLFLTRLQIDRNSNKALKKLLGSVRESLCGKSTDAPDVRFYNALSAWIMLYTTVDVPSKNFYGVPIIRIDEGLQAWKLNFQNGVDLIDQVVQALELDSIDRDLLNATGHYLPHPKRYSEGRYGYTRYYVRRALNAIPRDQTSELLLKLINCADEGIRWAVAAEILFWWMRVQNSIEAKNILLRLLSDEHPWVVREALQQLANDPYLCQIIGIDVLTRHAEESSEIAREKGWEIIELSAAKMRIAALSFAPPS